MLHQEGFLNQECSKLNAFFGPGAETGEIWRCSSILTLSDPIRPTGDCA